MLIDLIWLSPHIIPPPWLVGEVYITESTPFAVSAAIHRCLEQGKADALLFWDGEISALPSQLVLEALLDQPVDLWHAGLSFGVDGLPGLLDYVQPTWMFNRDPDPSLITTSWRVSLKACLVRLDVIRQIGFFEPGFDKLDAAALDWGHRCLRHGVLCRNVPALGSEFRVEKQSIALSAEDETRFVYYQFGKRWTIWAVSRAILSGYFTLRQGFMAFQALRRNPHPKVLLPFRHSFGEVQIVDQIPRVSVLIPTLERYPYLRTLLNQLRQQTIQPAEVIIVDQTPISQREEEFYTGFQDLPLKIIYQDHPGQCSSRNMGIKVATGDYILFIDDDDEISGNLIEQHLLNLQQFQVEVSCGVAVEPDAGPLPKAFTYLRDSDVFPTNNSLVQRTALLRSGLFDLAYERGARADADLGMRLYLSGAQMILNPAIEVLHHHAPRGGLRAHRARKITYASSRKHLLHRQSLNPTELYLAKRYFANQQVTEWRWIKLFATFSLHGKLWRRVLKFMLGLLMLPFSWLDMVRSDAEANQMLEHHPTIPLLDA